LTTKPVRIKKKKTFKCINCKEESIGYSNRKFCSLDCQGKYDYKNKIRDIEDGKIAGKRSLKKYLINKHGYKCQNSDCGWDWSKPTTVEIEHLDGNPKNNILMNVTLLCPNCHSQTSTYKIKNSNRYKKEKLLSGEAPH